MGELFLKKISIIWIVAALFFSLTMLSGCGGEPVDAEKVRQYADPATENVLAALNGGSYESFSRDFDKAMKEALPEKTFKEFSTSTRTKIGDYLSKEFYKAEKQKQYTVIYYRARFSKESDDVIVKTVFSENEGKHQVSGFFMDSPGLRK